MKLPAVFTFVFIVAALCITGAAAGLPPNPASLSPDAQVTTSLSDIALFFTPNEGQADASVLFSCRAQGYTLFFTPDRVVTSLTSDDSGAIGRSVVFQRFSGSNPDPVVEGLDQLETKVSYFIGPEADWHTGITPYGAIVYRDIYPGIDLVYRDQKGAVKREFVVGPGADPSRIRILYEGADQVRVAGDGSLVIRSGSAEIHESLPYCYQDVSGERKVVSCRFDQAEDGTISLFLGWYDRTLPLLIDPVLSYCGYIGGTQFDEGLAIAVDDAGSAYVTGLTYTDQTVFPVTVGPDLTYAGNGDVFVAKVNAAGTGLVYCGYIGGEGEDIGNGIALDDAGNAYVTGETRSNQTTFPVSVGPDLTFNNGTTDAFVAKVNAAGTSLVYCGYVGGNSSDHASGIAVDTSGNAYITGRTVSDQVTFPVTVGPNLTYGGNGDGFIARVNTWGTGLSYCGYIGGLAEDTANDIAVDPAGNAYVVGSTSSRENMFPVKIGPDLTHNGGYYDVFVTKVNAAGTGLSYCGYIGGIGYDEGYGIAVDNAGNAYITGSTSSNQTTFPVTVGPDLTLYEEKPGRGGDAFVAKVNVAGTGLSYCGYIGGGGPGGSGTDVGCDIVVDSAGNAYVTGFTTSNQTTFPVSVGPDLTPNGDYDAFVAKVNTAGTGLAYCSYLGGMWTDYGYGIAVDPVGNTYVTGATGSNQTSFPVTVGPGLTFGTGTGWADAFVARIPPLAWVSPGGSTVSSIAMDGKSSTGEWFAVIRGTDNHVYFDRYTQATNSWSGWTALGGTTYDEPTVAYTANNYVHIVIRGADNVPYAKKLNLNTNTWDAAWTSLGGHTSSAPTLLSWSSAQIPGDPIQMPYLWLAIRGTDNHTYLKWWVPVTGWDAAWRSWGGTTSDRPSLAFWYDPSMSMGTLTMGVRGADNKVYTRSTTFDSGGAGSLGAWTSPGGSTSSPPVIRYKDGIFHIVVRGTDNHVYSKAGSNPYMALGGTTLDIPAAYSWPDRRYFEVSVRGADSKVYTNVLNLDANQWTGWTAMKGSAASHPTFFRGTWSDGVLAIRGTDNHVYVMVV